MTIAAVTLQVTLGSVLNPSQQSISAFSVPLNALRIVDLIVIQDPLFIELITLIANRRESSILLLVASAGSILLLVASN